MSWTIRLTCCKYLIVVVALVFQQLDVDARAIQMNYVGVLKHIVQLNYGLVNTPTILFRCESIKHTNNWGSNKIELINKY